MTSFEGNTYKLINQSMGSLRRRFLLFSAVKECPGSGARLPAFPALPPPGANDLTSLYLCFFSPQGSRASNSTHLIKLNELIHVKYQEQCLAHSKCNQIQVYPPDSQQRQSLRQVCSQERVYSKGSQTRRWESKPQIHLLKEYQGNVKASEKKSLGEKLQLHLLVCRDE